MLTKKLLVHLPAWLAWASIAGLLIMALAIGGRLVFSWQPMTVFKAYQYAALLCLGCAGLAALLLMASAFYNQITSRAWLAAALLSGSLPLIIAVLMVKPAGFAAPLIHDITTDTQEPPAFVAVRALRQAGENSADYGGETIAQKQKQAFPDIAPLMLNLPPEHAWRRAGQAVQALGWTLVAQDEAARTIEACDATALFGFVDDVSIRIRPAGPGSRLDIRSASRIGRGDLGANARRIRLFINKFNSL